MISIGNNATGAYHSQRQPAMLRAVVFLGGYASAFTRYRHEGAGRIYGVNTPDGVDRTLAGAVCRGCLKQKGTGFLRGVRPFHILGATSLSSPTYRPAGRYIPLSISGTESGTGKSSLLSRSLVAPDCPVGAFLSGEQLQERSRGTGFDDRKDFVGLSAVFPLHRLDDVDLPSTRFERSSVFPSGSKENQLGGVSEIETDPPSIGSPILPNFVPNDVRLVSEAPCLHHSQPIGKECIRNPEVEMRCIGGVDGDGKLFDLLQGHRPVAVEPFMLGGNLAR